MRMTSLLAVAGLLGGMTAPTMAQTGPCESFVANLGGIVGTSYIGGVTVSSPSVYFAGTTYANVPPFCKVSATLTPTSDSAINVELWMPTVSWNGKFQGVGNGGYAGTYAQGATAMVAGLQAGFAIATTDMGTAPSSNGNADALIGHPQKWIDFGWRATQLMTVFAKDLVQRFYSRAPEYSYWNGCSTGGQQGLMLAQRSPELYDGIMAGAAAGNRTHVHTSVLWNYRASHRSPLGLFFSTDQTKAMVKSQLAACTAKSGGQPGDPFLTDPRACDWDPAVMQCAGLPDGICLTAEQVVTARAKYQGPRNPRTGKQIYPGQMRGGEADSQFGWAAMDTNTDMPPFGSLFKWVNGPLFNYQYFNFDTDMAGVDSILASNLNANSVDLSLFRARGGKLITYHGWSDALASPQESINYYERVVAAERKGNKSLSNVQKDFRLFMVPGMYHCGYGPGPNAMGQPYTGNVVAQPPLKPDAGHDLFRALQAWVEGGVPPTRVVATKYRNDDVSQGVVMTRPICAYPNVPRYSGSGDKSLAASFSCAPSTGVTDPAQITAPEYTQ